MMKQERKKVISSAGVAFISWLANDVHCESCSNLICYRFSETCKVASQAARETLEVHISTLPKPLQRVKPDLRIRLQEKIEKQREAQMKAIRDNKEKRNQSTNISHAFCLNCICHSTRPTLIPQFQRTSAHHAISPLQPPPLRFFSSIPPRSLHKPIQKGPSEPFEVRCSSRPMPIHAGVESHNLHIVQMAL